MSTRRTHLAGLAGLAAGSGLGLAATRSAVTQTDPLPPLTARRTELTLPNLPTLGLPYICRLDLFDEAGATVGTAAAGEIHYQRVMDRFGDYPRTAVGAILGGTGAYRDLRGEVDISWPDLDRIELLVRPAGSPA